MPGFAISPESSFGKSNTGEIRRKHRWYFSTLGTTQFGGIYGLLYLKTATKPEVEILPLEMHYEQERAWFAGKHQWNDIELVWYDAEQPDISSSVYNWINEVINLKTATASSPATHKRDALLEHQSSSMDTPEIWKLYNSWPYKANWGDLDYSSSDFVELKVTMKYDRAEFIAGNTEQEEF